MKKALLAAILGIVASVTTTYGSGSIYFDNYVTFGSMGAPIYLDHVGGAPVPIGATVQLYYQLGTAADPISTGTLLGTTTIGSNTTPPGYYNYGAIIVPDYISGNISFQVYCNYNGRPGYSSTLVLPTIATGAAIPTELDIPSFALVPEPSTFALAGLGAAGLFVFRRREN